MNETNNKKTSLKDFLLSTVIDPVLWYTALIMAALMYHYSDWEETEIHAAFYSLRWGAVTLAAGWLLFRVFDFMQKHHLLGSLAYLAVSLLIGEAFRGAVNKGSVNYPITWGLWFLTPQDSMNYNKWYAFAFYMLFMLFMASVIYYFTKVRYRVFMNFLIFIIPFAIYGKEYEKMPTIYIILLSVGYVLLMVYYRQLKDDENTIFVGRRKSWRTIAVYAAIFAVISAIVPKPAVEADRTILENLISAEELTSRLDAMLNVFRNVSNGDQFRDRSRNRLVYEVAAAEPLRIKTATRSTYNFETDEWNIQDIDDHYYSASKGTPFDIGTKMGLADAFMEAARLDSDFADKYGLNGYLSEGLAEPKVNHVVFYLLNGLIGLPQGTDMAPVPQGAITMTDCSVQNKTARLIGGTVLSVNTPFPSNARFEFDYSANTFFYSPKNREFIDHIDTYDYKQLLDDTYDVLRRELAGSTDPDKVRLYNYFEVDYECYDQYLEYLLDYGNRKRIKALSDEITKDCESEYDKALALESYFYNNDYTYDLTYDTSGKNAEDFMFVTKTGVCYEYATSMVLLARAAGIPARYCEGYNMSDRLERGNMPNTTYGISLQDAHGFPELYLRGYGWLSFEPTVSDNIITKKKTSSTDMLSRAGMIMLVGSLIALLFALVYPWLSHKFFILRSKKRLPADTVRAIVHRICKVYDIDEANTSREVSDFVHESTGADISYTAQLFDRSEYGGENVNIQEKEKALSEYITAYNAFREAKKRRRITNR